MSSATADALPHDVLVLVFHQLGFPHRFNAAAVCHQWRKVAAGGEFTRHVTGSINSAIQKARPGDTLIIPSGFYDETVLVDRPLKLVGQQIPNLRGVPRRSVVIQSRRTMAVLCNAEACIESVTVRTLAGSDNRSIIAFGPDCPCISLDNCDLAGSSGLMIPASKDSARLVLRHCSIHSVPHPIAAIAINAGSASLTGCSVYCNNVAIDVLKSARITMSNCDVSFNQRALDLDGSGIVKDCIFWGNEQLLGFACEPGDTMPTSSVAGGSPAPPQAELPMADAAATALTAQRSAQPASTVRGVGAASGMVFSGNHVRTTQRDVSDPIDDEGLRRKVRQLAREAYGNYAPDYDQWEILGDTDLDTDTSTEEDEQQVDTTSDSSMGGGIVYSSGDDTDNTGFDSNSSSSDGDDGLSASSGWITDSSSNGPSGSSDGGVAQMAHVLMGGALSDSSGDGVDWDPAASP